MIILDEEVNQITSSQLAGLLVLVILITISVLFSISVILRELYKHHNTPSRILPLLSLSVVILCLVGLFATEKIANLKREAEEYVYEKITASYSISEEETTQLTQKILHQPLDRITTLPIEGVVAVTRESVIVKTGKSTYTVYQKAEEKSLLEYPKRR